MSKLILIQALVILASLVPALSFANRCTRMAENAGAVSIDPISEVRSDPLAKYVEVQQRARQWARAHPKNPLDFAMREYLESLNWLKEKLGETLKEYKDEKRLPEIALAEAVLLELATFTNDNIPYQRFIVAGWYGSIAMAFNKKNDGGRGVKYQYDARKALQEFQRSKETRDLPMYIGGFFKRPDMVLLPTPRDLDIYAFLDIMGVPLFYTGLSDRRGIIDGQDMDSFLFFVHDLGHAIGILEGFTPALSIQEITILSEQAKQIVDEIRKIKDPDFRLAVATVLFSEIHEDSNFVKLMKDASSTKITVDYFNKNKEVFDRMMGKSSTVELFEKAEKKLLAIVKKSLKLDERK